MGPEKDNLRSKRADLRPEKAGFRPEKTDVKSGGLGLGIRGLI